MGASYISSSAVERPPALGPKVVIAHDFCELFGGAERFTAELATLYPEAAVVAILGRESVTRRMGISDRTHFLLPGRERLLEHYRLLAPFYFGLVKMARLPPADVLLSSNYAYVQGLRAPPGARHICYTWGPFRHLWSQQDEYAARAAPGPLRSRLFAAYATAARRFDRAATASVDTFVTSSPYSADLLKRAYGRGAEVLAPPIDCERFTPGDGPAEDYFLFVGRLLEAYKRPSLVVRAFSQMPDLQLKIAGDGPDMEYLRGMAGPNIEFLGHLEDRDLISEMQRCRATVFPSIDDFGMVPLEVNACGRPVICFAGGGALHTVDEARTGRFFYEQTPEGVMSAVRAFQVDDFDPKEIRAHALRFDRPAFQARFRALVDRLV